jgi:exonuclease III
LDSDVRIATWNVNSVLARLPRLVEWLEQAAPDVVCLQETKAADAVKDAWVDREARKGKAPSDHAPVIVDLALATLAP